MNRFVQLWEDIAYLWEEYGSLYLSGIWETVLIAVLGTLVGCVIGLMCGVLNTIPYSKQDSVV